VSARTFAVRSVADNERDEEVEEAWTRDVPARGVLRHVHGVEASKHMGARKFAWHVTVWVMEFVRDEPLEGELRRRVGAALRKVSGVKKVAEEDREVWVVDGAPSGEALALVRSPK
jgi:hypothetical protein